MQNENVFFTTDKYSNLTDEQIISQIKQGDQESLAYLLEKYKNLVNIKVSKYFMIGAEKEDILQEGMIGLFKAIKDFKEEKQKSINQKYEGVENLQRWFLMNNRQEDGRNNMLRDYALAMLDNGMTSDNVRHSLYDFNDKLDNPLSQTELESTIMKTVIRKEIERENANG